MTERAGQGASPTGSGLAGWVGRIGGPILALAVYLFLGGADGLTPDGRKVAACGTLMAVFWMTEAMPLAATSLLPLLLFPLARVLKFEQAAAPYANKFIFLFLGGFMIAAAIERWNLHRRIALSTVLAVGTRPSRLVGGFMVATAGLSMWISNTATTMLMLPIAMSTVGVLVRKETEATCKSPPSSDASSNHLATCLLLAIAYAASIGGVSTLIGTPPNAFMAGFLETKGIVVGFGQWMALGVPLAALLLLITWILLTRWIYPLRIPELEGGRRLIRQELSAMGPMSRGERIVLCVFVATATLWIARGPLTSWTWLTDRFPAMADVNDATIALLGALLLFVIPVDLKRGTFALDWPSARKLPWGVLLLFGGGLSLAEAVSQSGLTKWIGSLVGRLEGLPAMGLVLIVVAMVILLTEVTSNLATAAALLPIVYGVAIGLQVEPVLLVVPAAIAASCAFMLPVATPPNAIVFGSGRVTIGQMVRAGFWLNLVGIAVIPCFVYALGAWLLGVGP